MKETTQKLWNMGRRRGGRCACNCPDDRTHYRIATERERRRTAERRALKREHSIAQEQRIRARKFGVEGAFTGQEWALMKEWFGGRCAACHQAKLLCADHVNPISKGGLNVIENIQPLCRNCNNVKCDKATDYRDPKVLAAFLSSARLACVRLAVPIV